MARWGEGDPRWIVEDRPDATNVNNWHWTEKNATPWSKDRIKTLLEGFIIENEQGMCKITEVKKLEGEATANNRKGKLIFLYEWNIKCAWEGTLKYDTEKYEGRVEIPNLSDENCADDLDVTVTIKSTEDDAHKLKNLMIKYGTPLIQAQLAKYITELKEEFSKGLILPTLDKSGNQSGPINAGQKSKKPTSAASEVILNTENVKNLNISSGPVKIHTKSLTLKEEFKCTAEELYNAFTRLELLQAFTRGPCESDLKPGGQFSLYNGVVRGKYQELVPDKKIVMEWHMKGWPDAHYSNVTLTFNQKEDCTELELRQTGIPDAQLEQTENGWKRHYFEAMKQTFGFGARLF